MDSVREGEGGKIWENGIETCKISCMKRDASPGRCTILDAWGWCTGMTQRDGMGREVGGRFRMGEHVYTHGGFMSMYGKNHYNIAK